MSRHRDALDRSLALKGESVILRRVVASGTATAAVDAPCLAFVRKGVGQEVSPGVGQRDYDVILSPTDIERAQWPGGLPVRSPPTETDPRIPVEGDQLIVQGRARLVRLATPTFIAGELVRIDLQVRG
ncbi:MAG: hypothetical protein AB7O80_12840 [Acetobacteraceae bacterium]